jgi:uncharacterized protein (DUF362 family)
VFIKGAAVGGLGLAVGGPLAGTELLAREAVNKSRIVLVRHPRVVDAAGHVQAPILKEMIARAMDEFTGKTGAKEIWGPFLNTGRPVGLKLNTLGLSGIRKSTLTQHFSAVTSVVVDQLKAAGCAEKDLIIWDRSDEELANAGLTIQKNPGSLRVLGVIGDRSSRGDDQIAREYEPTYYPVGNKKVRLCRVLTDQFDTLISIPLLKHHRLAGITGALKSHFGSIDNPGQFHSSRCVNPGIPEINAIPLIRKKQKLIIADALMGLCDGGPWWNPRHVWPYGGIVVGTDPVAMDAVLLKIIDEERKTRDLQPIARSIRQLKLSEQLGLGTCDPARIDLKTIRLG